MDNAQAAECIDAVLNSEYHYDESLGYQLTSDDFEWLEKAKEALLMRSAEHPTITKHKYAQENSDKLIEVNMTHCPHCFKDKQLGYFDSLIDKGTEYCRRCGKAIDWSNISNSQGETKK